MAYYDFTEMPVWQMSMEVIREVYQLTAKLPKCEDYALRGQLRDASVSIAGNIAEGFGRGHMKDKINFYLFSRGSAFEVRSHLIAGKEVGYFSQEEISTIDVKCLKVIEALNKITKGLQPGSSSPPPKS